ncbi:ligase-associated DNA damage response DEXH box helicase [Owenweeksia hongkongensis]|uniref:ligase-associated DNA damage response DEXH box helicase n=1 Tax=Owenweeksia hongkongensis TaxID=253245 RepID=UPI003A949B8B
MKESKKIFSQAQQWFQSKGWQVAPFQEEAWQAYADGKSGLVNAPTGSGKTYSLMLPVLLSEDSASPRPSPPRRGGEGVRCIWITPIRALAKEIFQSAERAIEALDLDWTVDVRTGDTTTAQRAKQKAKMPNLLITTPESLHLLISSKGYDKTFKNLKCVVVDEWHELMGSKRAVQMELALSRLRGLNPILRTWGISATIGNMEKALEVLLGPHFPERETTVIKADIHKKIEVVSILPDEVETLPWAGHLGIKMLKKVLPVIDKSESTLIFTNTRSMAEIWYQKILDVAPKMAGIMAMHHGSISRDIRFWVEDALHTGLLKAVVCTSSLDLGVDFRPVESIVQIGSPKGVARFMQRAGRSGHQPGATSRIYFVPTHTLELVEAAALRQGIVDNIVEEREPYIRSFDVLVQYLVTLAVSDGFYPKEIFEEVKKTFSYESISPEEWQWCLDFITTGGKSLSGYDEFHKVEIMEDGLYKVTSRRTAMRHRMSMGTIVSDAMIKVKFQRGGYLGSIEEYFFSRLKPGDVFWFAGQNLELVKMRGMIAEVRKANTKNGLVPSWKGGRMPLSAKMGAMLRRKIEESVSKQHNDPELKLIEPLWELQRERSHIPSRDEFLIEKYKSEDGYHLFFYPFEGRLVHEGMATLLAYRLSLFKPLTFSIAMNDYGFELLADSSIPIEEALDSDVFTLTDLREDIMQSVNAVEMARRRFRDISGIAGLIFTGYPGQPVKDRHLQSSSQLIFNVLQDYEPDNLLLQQAYDEALEFQLEEGRLRKALERIHDQKILIQNMDKPSPFSFPIMVDRMSRDKLTSESLEDQVKKMKLKMG